MEVTVTLDNGWVIEGTKEDGIVLRKGDEAVTIPKDECQDIVEGFQAVWTAIRR